MPGPHQRNIVGFKRHSQFPIVSIIRTSYNSIQQYCKQAVTSTLQLLMSTKVSTQLKCFRHLVPQQCAVSSLKDYHQYRLLCQLSKPMHFQKGNQARPRSRNSIRLCFYGRFVFEL